MLSRMPQAPAQPAQRVLDSIEHGAILAIKGSSHHLTKDRRSYEFPTKIPTPIASTLKNIAAVDSQPSQYSVPPIT